MLPVLQIGPLAIQTSGLILLAGLWVGMNLAEKHALDRGVKPDQLYNLIALMLITGVIGARLGYAAHYLPSFIQNPISLLSLNPGLLDPLSGLVVSLITGLIYIHQKSLPFWSVCDALIPLLGVLQIAISLANLANGDGYGTPSDLPWAISLWGEMRHPSQVYEFLAGVFILWMFFPGSRLGRSRRAGESFLRFGAYSAGARLFLEAFRGDSYLLPGGIRGEQLLAWVILGAFLICWRVLSERAEQQPRA